MTTRPRRNTAPPPAGVIDIQLTGHSDTDLRALLERMRAAGIVVRSSPDYAFGTSPVRRYVTADLRPQAD